MYLCSLLLLARSLLGSALALALGPAQLVLSHLEGPFAAVPRSKGLFRQLLPCCAGDLQGTALGLT